jgi:GNAT superfamily N-acetyltransferase
MYYNIDMKNNKLFFVGEHEKAIVTIYNNCAEISLLKVDKQFRKLGFATKLIRYLVEFISTKLHNITKIYLSPLPLESDNSLNLQDLIRFYEKFNFQLSTIPPNYAPFMMERYI